MEKIALILFLSSAMWLLIDRAKVAWKNCPWGKWITIGVSAVLSFTLCFSYDLDIVYALGAVTDPSSLGRILTSLCLMSGSSGIAEIIGFFKKS